MTTTYNPLCTGWQFTSTRPVSSIVLWLGGRKCNYVFFSEPLTKLRYYPRLCDNVDFNCSAFNNYVKGNPSMCRALLSHYRVHSFGSSQAKGQWPPELAQKFERVTELQSDEENCFVKTICYKGVQHHQHFDDNYSQTYDFTIVVDLNCHSVFELQRSAISGSRSVC